MSRATDWSEISTIVYLPFHRVERIFARPDPTSRLGSGGENAWTDIQTGQANFIRFVLSPEEVSERSGSMLTHSSQYILRF